MKAGKTTKYICNTILSVLGVVWLIPIFFVIMNIFKTKQEYNLGSFWSLPAGNAFTNLSNNFKSIVTNKVFNSVGASLLYSAVGTALAVFIAILAAYGLTHLHVQHKMFWFLFIYSGTIFPFQIYLIPVYMGYQKLHLYNTIVGMIIFYCAICIPFAMFVLRNFFLGISKEMVEAAQMEGATKWQILVKIFLPMSKAPLSVVILSQFTWCWNDLMFGLTFTKSAEIRPIMATISTMSAGNAPTLFLTCIFASLPTIILYFLLQKNFDYGFVYTSK